MNNVKPCKFIIIESSPVIRQGLVSLFKDNPDFSVQNTYSDLQSFQDSKTEDVPDIIFINPAIIHPHKTFPIKALFADYTFTIFVAIIYKYVNPEILNEFDGILDIYDETSVILSKLQETLKKNYHRKKTQDDENVDLSEREKEILASVALGLTNKEIADKHFISIHTVVSHRKNITRKTGIKTVSGLTLYAMFNNLISPSDLK